MRFTDEGDNSQRTVIQSDSLLKVQLCEVRN